MTLAERQALCFACESEICIFSQEGECRLPLVTGMLPVQTERDGCLAGLPFEEWNPVQSSGRNHGVMEDVPERAVYLWRCMCKALANAPRGSKIWGVNTTHIHLRNEDANNAAGALFNDLAGAEFFNEGYIHPLALMDADLNIETLREPENADAEDLWNGLTALAQFNMARHRERQATPLVLCPGDDKLYVKEKAAAEGLADIFLTLGLDVKMDFFPVFGRFVQIGFFDQDAEKTSKQKGCWCVSNAKRKEVRE